MNATINCCRREWLASVPQQPTALAVTDNAFRVIHWPNDSREQNRDLLGFLSPRGNNRVRQAQPPVVQVTPELTITIVICTRERDLFTTAWTVDELAELVLPHEHERPTIGHLCLKCVS